MLDSFEVDGFHQVVADAGVGADPRVACRIGRDGVEVVAAVPVVAVGDDLCRPGDRHVLVAAHARAAVIHGRIVEQVARLDFRRGQLVRIDVQPVAAGRQQKQAGCREGEEYLGAYFFHSQSVLEG